MPAKEAFDVIYSVTRVKQERYGGFGIDSLLLTWGCHPELIAIGDASSDGRRRTSRRTARSASTSPDRSWASESSFPEMVEAFTRARGDHLRPLDPRPWLTARQQLEKADDER